MESVSPNSSTELELIFYEGIDETPEGIIEAKIGEEDGMGMVKGLSEEQIGLFQDTMALGYHPKMALFILLYSKATEIGHIFDFVTSDAEGKYHHLFMPFNGTCAICGNDNRELHLEANSSREKRRALAIKETIKSLSLYPEETRKGKKKGKGIQEPLLPSHEWKQKSPKRKGFLVNASPSSFSSFLLGDQGLNRNSEEEEEEEYEAVLCEICMIERRVEQTLKIQDKIHPICTLCFEEYLKFEIENGKVKQLKCPHCSEALTYEIIKKFTSPDLFQKFEKFYDNMEVNKNPLLRWCPNHKCGKIITLQSIKSPKGRCESCQTEICPKCNKDFHPHKKCSDVMEKEIKAFLKGNDAEKCPKCGVLVLKASGCNHMTCGVCGFEWCWLCGATYTSLHFLPLNPLGCPNLQAGSNSRKRWTCCKLIMLRFLMVLVLILLAPLAMLVSGPALAFACMGCASRESMGCFYLLFCGSFFLLFGILLDVLLIPLEVICILPGLLFLGFFYVSERVRLKNRYNRKMKLREARLASQKERERPIASSSFLMVPVEEMISEREVGSLEGRGKKLT